MSEPQAFKKRIRIGERIREVRRKNYLTQVKLAEKADLSQSYMSQIEKGFCLPSDAAMASIARALKTSVKALVHGTRS